MISRQEARAIRAMIEKASASLDDTDALEAVCLFPAWAKDTVYTVNERVRYGEKLYKCVQTHTSQTDWEPLNVPALWTEVAKPGEIPVWRQPTGAQDAYQKNDKVWYPEKNTTIYISIIENNIWSPETYPAGWEKII